jgi:hypothetical protein
MKKVLTTLLLLVSLAGIGVASDASATLRQTRVQAANVTGGNMNALVLQDNNRRRMRWRRARWNRGRTDNTWNRGRWNRRRWNRRDWNRGRTNNNWNRGRRNR